MKALLPSIGLLLVAVVLQATGTVSFGWLVWALLVLAFVSTLSLLLLTRRR